MASSFKGSLARFLQSQVGCQRQGYRCGVLRLDPHFVGVSPPRLAHPARSSSSGPSPRLNLSPRARRRQSRLPPPALAVEVSVLVFDHLESVHQTPKLPQSCLSKSRHGLIVRQKVANPEQRELAIRYTEKLRISPALRFLRWLQGDRLLFIFITLGCGCCLVACSLKPRRARDEVTNEPNPGTLSVDQTKPDQTTSSRPRLLRIQLETSPDLGPYRLPPPTTVFSCCCLLARHESESKPTKTDSQNTANKSPTWES